jgi:hypothetical protein
MPRLIRFSVRTGARALGKTALKLSYQIRGGPRLRRGRKVADRFSEARNQRSEEMLELGLIY